ncbi:hypothetical protein [Planctomicrobium sp. SH527]|uniref:hypothetical protein n=1 Tax=Planctomicrobium sp. SH527 TaxID=3448123 RepID=UPI003F5B5398
MAVWRMNPESTHELPNQHPPGDEPVSWGVALAAWWKQSRWQIAGLSLAIAILYFPVLNFQLLNWDDTWYLTSNELIRSWHPANLYRIATEPVARNFAPITIFTFLIEHTLWGLHPTGYHVTNVLLHLVNAVLVLHLMKRLTGNDWLSFSVAILFAVHPVQIESVAWISSRKTVLSSTFMLASFLCWMRPDRTAKQEGWGIFWLILGLLTKASTVVIPPIIVAYDVLIARKKLSDAIARQVVPTLLCMMLIFSTMNAQVTIVGGLRGHIGMSKFQLLAVNLTLLWRYLAMLIWPQNLCVLYNPPTSGITALVIASALGWGLVTVWLYRIRKRVPLITLAGISALLIMVPMLNLFPLTTLMNDRYLYLTCVPCFAVMGWLVQQLGKILVEVFPILARLRKLAAITVTTAAIGLMAWGTVQYLPTWRDPLSLWNHARITTPSLPTVHYQWALALNDAGRTHEAIAALEFALANSNPDQVDQERILKLKQRLQEETRASM